MTEHKMRAIQFHFGDGAVYDGFTDDSRWNGFLNVWATEQAHQQVLADYKDSLAESGFDEISPNDAGLFSYANGYATLEVRP